MEYIEMKLLKQSEKSMVHMIQEKQSGQLFIRKKLKGRLEVYQELQNCQHPGLPHIYEAEFLDDSTEVIEEYIEGQPLGSTQLSDRQLLDAVKELCSVLEALHGRGIIHRDIKPSNLILDKEGHIRLIDFDAARMPKSGRETDTRLLGTRGYAPPEQFGFAQTDVRTDIYALGVTLEQLFGEKAKKLHCRHMIQKCMKLDPDKRYQSVKEFERAFFHRKRRLLCAAAALILLLAVFLQYPFRKQSYHKTSMAVLPAPENPHWDGDTGIGVWNHVPDSGDGAEAGYHWRLYWSKTDELPDLSAQTWVQEGSMRGNNFVSDGEEAAVYQVSLSEQFQENGFYYFAVSADGDGGQYESSPYAISDAFAYTGESAPLLQAPAGLTWKKAADGSGNIQYYAAWDNLDDYEDADSFNVRVYNADGDFAGNNIWTKEEIVSIGQGGVWIDRKMMAQESGPYRFTVQVYSSRPNEYHSTIMPDEVPEEYFSPWNDIE